MFKRGGESRRHYLCRLMRCHHRQPRRRRREYAKLAKSHQFRFPVCMTALEQTKHRMMNVLLAVGPVGNSSQWSSNWVQSCIHAYTQEHSALSVVCMNAGVQKCTQLLWMVYTLCAAFIWSGSMMTVRIWAIFDSHCSQLPQLHVWSKHNITKCLSFGDCFN